METSAGSLTLNAYDRQVAAEDIRRARRCEPLMTQAERAVLKSDLQDQARARRPMTCMHTGGPFLTCNR